MININTERLTIRSFTLDDAPFVLKLLNDTSFIENIGDKGVRNLDQAHRYLQDGPLADYKRHGFGLWHVSLLDDDTPIGMTGFLKRDYLDDIDIGYAFLPEFCGLGYAFEATSAAMDYASRQLQAKHVLAIVKEENEPSIRLLKKLGFRFSKMVQSPNENKEICLFKTMNAQNIFNTYKPKGFHSVTPYLFVENPQKLISFLQDAFHAIEINRSLMPNGDIANVILQIGDTCFMISQAREEFTGMKTALYLYVNDVDMMHKRAVKCGATVSFEPDDMPYGDKQSGIIDPCGNYWWISKRQKEKGYHE